MFFQSLAHERALLIPSSRPTTHKICELGLIRPGLIYRKSPVRAIRYQPSKHLKGLFPQTFGPNLMLNVQKTRQSMTSTAYELWLTITFLTFAYCGFLLSTQYCSSKLYQFVHFAQLRQTKQYSQGGKLSPIFSKNALIDVL